MNFVDLYLAESRMLVEKLIQIGLRNKANFKRFIRLLDQLPTFGIIHGSNFMGNECRLPSNIPSNVYLVILQRFYNHYKKEFIVRVLLTYGHIKDIKKSGVRDDYKHLYRLFILYAFHSDIKYVKYLVEFDVDFINCHNNSTYEIVTKRGLVANLGYQSDIVRYVFKPIVLFNLNANEEAVKLDSFMLTYNHNSEYGLCVKKIPATVKFKKITLTNKILQKLTTKNMTKLIRYYT